MTSSEFFWRLVLGDFYDFEAEGFVLCFVINHE